MIKYFQTTNKKIRTIFFSMIFLSLAGNTLASSFPVTFKDVAGRTVTIKKQPKKIALSTARVFSALDIISGSKIVNNMLAWRNDMQTSAPSMYNYYIKRFPRLKDLKTIGLIKKGEFDIEKFIDMKPDILIMDISNLSYAKDSSMLTILEQAGIAVVVIDFREHPITNTKLSINALGKALGYDEKAQEYIQYYDEHLNNLFNSIPDNKQVRVFVERSAGWGGVNDCCYAFAHTNIAEFVTNLKGINIADKYFKGSDGKLAIEKVIEENPDIYVMVSTAWAREKYNRGINLGYNKTIDDIKPTVKALFDGRTWLSSLKSYKNENIYSLYMPYYNSPMNIVAYEYLAKWIYPNTFKNLHPENTFKDIYKKFTNADVDAITGINNLTFK